MSNNTRDLEKHTVSVDESDGQLLAPRAYVYPVEYLSEWPLGATVLVSDQGLAD